MIPMPRDDAPVWKDTEVLECVSVIPEAPGVMTFSFRPPSGARFHFRAGQFLTLDLPVPGNPVSRTFTISSSPTSTAYVSITVKVQDGSIGVRGTWPDAARSAAPLPPPRKSSRSSSGPSHS